MKTKMHSYLKAAIFCITVTAVFSCSGGDDNDSTNNGGGSNTEKIIGNWKYIGYYDAVEDEFFEDDFGPCYEEIIDFNSNGSGSWTEDDCGDITETNFTWEKEEAGVYVLTAPGQGTNILQVEFRNQNNRMYLMDDEDGSADVFKRQ